VRLIGRETRYVKLVLLLTSYAFISGVSIFTLLAVEAEYEFTWLIVQGKNQDFAEYMHFLRFHHQAVSCHEANAGEV
jgi:hypothetical protein